jgi:hypothetical protein
MHNAAQRNRASAAKAGYSFLPCPDCGLPIRLVSVAPASAPNIDEITYWCEPCQSEINRTEARGALIIC